jgi:predicted amidohydrolase
LTGRLEALAEDLRVYICCGLVERDDRRRYSTQVLVAPGDGLMGVYRKIQMADRERWFSQPGRELPVFDVAGVPTGVMTCRDKSFPEIARILALDGAQLLLNPHSTTDCPQHRFPDWSLKLCTARAMENGCYLIANNNIADCELQVHQHGGYSFAIDPYGQLIHCDAGPGDRERMALIEVDTRVVAERRAAEGKHFNLWSRHPEAYGRLVRSEGSQFGNQPFRPES